MKGISKGFDPDLGRKFAQELNGSVIGRARSLPKASKPLSFAQRKARLEAEMPAGMDAQEQHDWLQERLAAGD